MKRFGSRRRTSAAIATVVFVLVGCGGDGGGASGRTSSAAQNQNFAPGSVSGQTLLLEGALTRELRFDPSGNLWTEDRAGTFHGGTYQYTANANVAELILSESGITSTIRLTFSSAEAGTYLAGQEQGTFRLLETQSDPNGPGTGPIDPADPGGQALAPASLDGRTLHGTRTFTSTGPNGQTHVYTFAGNSFHDSDPPEESNGTYIYEPAGGNAVLRLSYLAPREFNGDQHRLEMSFSTGTSGSFESVYTRRDGTTIQINGTFQIE